MPDNDAMMTHAGESSTIFLTIFSHYAKFFVSFRGKWPDSHFSVGILLLDGAD